MPRIWAQILLDSGDSQIGTLQRSEGLDAHFPEMMSIDESGIVRILPDEMRVANVAQKAAFGLYLHRYKPKYHPKLQEFFVVKPMHDRDPNNFIVTMAHTERFQPRRWVHLQTIAISGRKVQVCDYMFVRNWVYNDFGRLFCIMRFHETIWVAVRCPNPSSLKRKGSLHSGGRLDQEDLFS